MSEHQYYEFQSLDQPLSSADQTYIRGLSSRASVSATRASFVYNYGDFRGDPKKVLDRCFDLMLYVANFGTRQIVFRFPKTLIDGDRPEQAASQKTKRARGCQKGETQTIRSDRT